MKGDGQPYVLIVDANHKVDKVAVTLGIQGADRVAVLGGLTEKQSVIVSGQDNYKVGQQVRPKLTIISMPKQEDTQ
jgi:multidrug efflux pump subunit AcrA (membrane-fusion protein)